MVKVKMWIAVASVVICINGFFLLLMMDYFDSKYSERIDFNYSVTFACSMGVYRQDYMMEFARDQEFNTTFQFRPVSEWTYCDTCREVRPVLNGWVRL